MRSCVAWLNAVGGDAVVMRLAASFRAVAAGGGGGREGLQFGSGRYMYPIGPPTAIEPCTGGGGGGGSTSARAGWCDM
jgi:hypothetical protein